MEKKPIRIRTDSVNKENTGKQQGVIVDPQAFVQNKVTQRARKVKSVNEPMLYEIWHDKHYCDRYQHGDENGRRDGIDPDTVHGLLQDAIPYLMLFSASHAGFRFLNHDGNLDETVKTVLQKPTPAGMLNVVIWSHMIDPTFFEITIKTAMVVEDFRMDFGQYAVEINDKEVILKKMKERRTLQFVLTFPNML